MDNRSLLISLIECVIGAGKKILSAYHDVNMDTKYKQDNSPVTCADIAAHRFIINYLAKLTPDLPVLSEESKHVDFAIRKAWDQYWLVDPLDGTKEFIQRSGEFTVNIALIKQHKPIIGIIYAPILDKIYYAMEGLGAFLIKDQKSTKLKIEKPTRNYCTIVTSRSHNKDNGQLDSF